MESKQGCRCCNDHILVWSRIRWLSIASYKATIKQERFIQKVVYFNFELTAFGTTISKCLMLLPRIKGWLTPLSGKFFKYVIETWRKVTLENNGEKMKGIVVRYYAIRHKKARKEKAIKPNVNSCLAGSFQSNVNYHVSLVAKPRFTSCNTSKRLIPTYVVQQQRGRERRGQSDQVVIETHNRFPVNAINIPGLSLLHLHLGMPHS